MDISKCCNTNCPKREECFRYRVKPGYRQTYARFEFKDGKCWGFDEIGNWQESYLIPVGSDVKNIFESIEE